MERFFATFEQVSGYYANARVACDEDYMLLTNEVRPTISDR